MPAERITVSLDSELAAAVRGAAQECSESLSQWMAEAAKNRLKNLGFRQLITEWEAEHGAFTEEEKAASRAKLGL